jgi:hypothetical protein
MKNITISSISTVFSVHLVPASNKLEPEPKSVDEMRYKKTVTIAKYILIRDWYFSTLKEDFYISSFSFSNI